MAGLGAVTVGGTRLRPEWRNGRNGVMPGAAGAGGEVGRGRGAGGGASEAGGMAQSAGAPPSSPYFTPAPAPRAHKAPAPRPFSPLAPLAPLSEADTLVLKTAGRILQRRQLGLGAGADGANSTVAAKLRLAVQAGARGGGREGQEGPEGPEGPEGESGGEERRRQLQERIAAILASRALPPEHVSSPPASSSTFFAAATAEAASPDAKAQNPGQGWDLSQGSSYVLPVEASFESLSSRNEGSSRSSAGSDRAARLRQAKVYTKEHLLAGPASAPLADVATAAGVGVGVGDIDVSKIKWYL